MIVQRKSLYNYIKQDRRFPNTIPQHQHAFYTLD